MTDDLQNNHMALAEAPWTWRKALRQADLPASALRVGLALVDEFLNKTTGKIFPSFDKIAEASNMAPRTVRAGIDALRKAGLIVTKKCRFDGSLDFFLMLPAAARSDTKQSVREGDEVTGMRRTNRHKSVGRSDINLSDEVTQNSHLTLELNLRTEPGNLTSSPASGPADDGLRLSPLRSEPSSLQSEASASVSGQSVAVRGIPINESDFGPWVSINIPDQTKHREALRLLREGKMTPEDFRRLAA